MSEKTLRERAIELSKIHYALEVFREKTTDGDYVYLASNPELEECTAQGETAQEAIEALEEVRADYFEHLLEFDLPIPGPRFTATKDTSATSSVTREVKNVTFAGFEGYLKDIAQPAEREKILSVPSS